MSTTIPDSSSKDAGSWGRAWESSFFTSISSFLIIATTPFMVFFFYLACDQFNGSLLNTFEQVVMNGKLSMLIPSFHFSSIPVYAGWMALQLALYLYVPDFLHRAIPGYKGGNQKGAVTPAGNELPYEINGLQAWLISHLLFFGAAFLFGAISPTIIFDNWGSMLILANLFGNALAAFVYIKAHYFPTDQRERKFSGSAIYDFYMGIEFNPRIKNFDFKLFFNGRPGIVAWTLINISFAAKQYELYGTVTNSMLIVNLLQAVYVIHFFFYEGWYLRTIDICHDHFGWMLAWGDSVWLPWMYTLQGLYLVYNPVVLTTPYALFVLALGIGGYLLFLSANTQKDNFRLTNGKTPIWKKTPEAIPCSYTSADGKTRESKLLVSGWWGVSRHMNYTGDLMLSSAYCLACGFGALLPYFYIIFMAILLIHRCIRDEHRMENKYGQAWKEYCRRVPYRLIPGVF